MESEKNFSLIKVVSFVVGGLALILILAIALLSLIDAASPQQSARLYLLTQLGLIRNEKIVEVLEPRPPEKIGEEVTDLYFYPYDQETLSGEKGYKCQITGLLTEKKGSTWLILDRNGQQLTLELLGRSPDFYRVKIIEDLQTGKQEAEFDPIEPLEIKENDLVSVAWECPVDPKEMLTEEAKIKDEYLTVKPKAISIQE